MKNHHVKIFSSLPPTTRPCEKSIVEQGVAIQDHMAKTGAFVLVFGTFEHQRLLNTTELNIYSKLAPTPQTLQESAPTLRRNQSRKHSEASTISSDR